MAFSIRTNDNTENIKNITKTAIRYALEDVGDAVVGWAQDKLDEQDAVATGNLKSRIEYNFIEEQKIAAGTNVEYAIYVEMGTGKYAENGGRQTPWAYQDENGNWRITSGMKPRPYMRPAVVDHKEKIKRFIENKIHEELQ